MEKTCTACGAVKPLSEFYNLTPHKLMTRCKECHKAAVRGRYERKEIRRGPHITEKKCTQCGEVKPISEFYANRNTVKGYWHSRCKICDKATVTAYRHANPEKHREGSRRWAHENPRKVKNSVLMGKYGITVEEYDAMLAAQGGGCAICGARDPGNGTGHLHVDHCHDRGRVRALLCSECNLGLGKFRHRIDLLLTAAKYLQDYYPNVGENADAASILAQN